MPEPSSPRVLFADDDPILHRLIEVNFRAGHRDRGAATTRSRASSPRPDVLVLDATMPGMDGHEVYRRVRAEPAAADLPVIFLTGRSADEFDDYEGEHVRVITKPFDPADLIDAVREAIGMVAP